MGAGTAGTGRRRSEEMLNTGMARRGLWPIEEAWGAGSPLAGRGLLPLLAIQEARAALEREREHAVIEAQDVLSQADEALVMG
jgi:hypothetical protein